MDGRLQAVLTDHTVFLQKNLHVNEAFLGPLLQQGVITDVVRERIKAESTSAGKVSTIIAILKERKGNTFDLFLDALQQTSQGPIADQLYIAAYPVDGPEWDDKVSIGLETFIHKYYVNNKKWSLSDKATAMEHLVLRKDYNIQVAAKEQVSRRCEELECSTHEKDIQIKRLRQKLESIEEERDGESKRQLSKLREMLVVRSAQIKKLENENLDLLQEMDESATHHKYREIELQDKIDSYEKSSDMTTEIAQIEKLTKNVRKLESDLQSKKDSISDIQGQINAIKSKLGVRADAKDDEILDRIEKIKTDKQDLKKKYKTLKDSKSILKKEICSLQEVLASEKGRYVDVKKCLGVQPDATDADVMESLKRVATKNAEMSKKCDRLRKKLRELQINQRNFVNFNITVTNTEPQQKPDIPPQELVDKFCVICRSYIRTAKYAERCKFHHLGKEGSRWTCCNSLPSIAGCMEATHFYIEHDEYKTSLTNGVNAIELTPKRKPGTY